MLSGPLFGSGTASDASGRAVPYRLLRVDRSNGNLAELGRESLRWRETAHRLLMMREPRYWHGQPMGLRAVIASEVVSRAQFADEALARAAENVRQGVGSVVVAQAEEGSLLGVATYVLGAVNGRMTLFINDVAVSPDNLEGTPGSAQLRGIGTALVAAVSRDALKAGATRAVLHPLDAEARVFWEGRGFKVTGPKETMTLESREEIDWLIGRCEVEPDSGNVLCGQRKR